MSARFWALCVSISLTWLDIWYLPWLLWSWVRYLIGMSSPSHPLCLSYFAFFPLSNCYFSLYFTLILSSSAWPHAIVLSPTTDIRCISCKCSQSMCPPCSQSVTDVIWRQRTRLPCWQTVLERYVGWRLIILFESCAYVFSLLSVLHLKSSKNGIERKTGFCDQLAVVVSIVNFAVGSSNNVVTTQWLLSTLT